MSDPKWLQGMPTHLREAFESVIAKSPTKVSQRERVRLMRALAWVYELGQLVGLRHGKAAVQARMRDAIGLAPSDNSIYRHLDAAEGERQTSLIRRGPDKFTPPWTWRD